MIEVLQEYVDARDAALRVDRGQALIRGVKILGLRSSNGRTYLPAALEQAKSLYEGVKVNVNHPKGGPQTPRDYQERIGSIHGVHLRAEEGLFADFHFNPKHALAEQLLWDAEHAAENVGFSHNVQARTSRRGEELLVEAILKVQSVDLVADPATTRSLFENAAETSSLACTNEECVQLREELQRLEAVHATDQRQQLIQRLLIEQGLPLPNRGDAWSRTVVSEAFLRVLHQAPDEGAVRLLVEERARLVAETRRTAGRGGAAGPQSRDQALAEGARAMDGKAFARLVRR